MSSDRDPSLSLALERSASAPSVARRLVRERYRDEMTADRLSDLCLVVSELVTNAVNHGSGEIRLELQADGDVLRGKVTDDGPGFEYDLRARGIEDIGGRGLLIVAGVSEQWGVYDGSSHVWFELAVASPPDVTPVEPALGRDAAPDELG